MVALPRHIHLGYRRQVQAHLAHTCALRNMGSRRSPHRRTARTLILHRKAILDSYNVTIRLTRGGAHPCARASSARSGGHSASAAAPSSAGDASGRRAPAAGRPGGPAGFPGPALRVSASGSAPLLLRASAVPLLPASSSAGSCPAPAAMSSRANVSVDTATQHCTPSVRLRPAHAERRSTCLPSTYARHVPRFVSKLFAKDYQYCVQKHGASPAPHCSPGAARRASRGRRASML